jgi:hypothetical protein
MYVKAMVSLASTQSKGPHYLDLRYWPLMTEIREKGPLAPAKGATPNFGVCAGTRTRNLPVGIRLLYPVEIHRHRVWLLGKTGLVFPPSSSGKRLIRHSRFNNYLFYTQLKHVHASYRRGVRA